MARKPTYEKLTQRVKELENRLHTSDQHQKRLDRIFNLSLDMIGEGNLDGYFTKINSSFTKILGYSEKELIAKPFLEFVHDQDIQKTKDAFHTAAKGKRDIFIQNRYKCKNDSYKLIEWNVFAKAKENYFIAVGRDISERMISDDLRKKSETKYQDLYDHAPDMFLSIDFKTATIIECNQTLVGTLGYSDKKEILNRSVFDLYAPESAEYARNTVFQSFIKTGKINNEELRIRKKDGSIINISLNATAVRNQEGKILHTRSVWRDITKWKKIETALKKERNTSQLYLDVANVMLIAINPKGIVELINCKGCEILEYQQNEIIGKNWFDHFIPKRFRKEVKVVFKKLMAGKTELVEYFINPVRTKSGEEKIIEWQNTILKDDNGQVTGTLSSGNDITDRKKMEEEKSRLEQQLIQTQKMEAIGTLAGGIAHDFNNLLMGVLGNISIMLQDTTSSHPYYNSLVEINNYVKSAVNLTNQLLGFARGGKYEVRTTDINELIKEHNRMFGRTRKEITIRGTYDPKLRTAEVDSSQIKQVLMNIYVNACQAISDSGEIFIVTENVKLDKTYTQPFDLKYGWYLKISITDTGIGMDKEIIKRIFDPFFTTKEKERGTGMGLSSAYGIVKNHGGFITVYSEPGQGTTFNIYLPASKKKVKKEEKSVDTLITGSGTVLLIDDEDMILNIGERMLKRLGYDVIVASGGKSGIGAYQKAKEKIDIVILDMIMPGISGGEAFETLKSINPKVNVLLSSGYSLDGKAMKIIEQGCKGFIQKPFNMSQLSQKISEILSKK